MIRGVLKNDSFFEKILNIDDGGRIPNLRTIVQYIRDADFDFLKEVTSDDDILRCLLNLNVRGKKGAKHGKRRIKKYNSFLERWEVNPSLCLGAIVYAIMRRLCKECNFCPKKINDYMSSFQLYGWHGDHILSYWKKIKNPSDFAQKGWISDLICECIKCRLVCGFCHENGKIKDYERKLNSVNRLRYNSERTKYRSAREVMNLKEMKLFILELKARRAFWKGQDAYITWETLEFLVWKYFRIILGDVSYNTAEEFKNERLRRSYLVNKVIMNVTKKLGVKCSQCPMCIMNLNPAQTSGVHMDHRSTKTLNPSRAMDFNVDIFIQELVNGDCHPTCCFCHGKVTL